MAEPDGDGPDLDPRERCPTCGKPTIEASRPFCSKRCAEVDLHRWLSGAYVIPAAPDDEDDDAQGGAGQGGRA